MACSKRLCVLRRARRFDSLGPPLGAASARGVDDGDMLALADGEAFHLDLYVDEKWLGSRVRAALTSRMLVFDKQYGYTAAFTKINVFNRKAMKSARLRGWKPAGLVLRVRGSRR